MQQGEEGWLCYVKKSGLPAHGPVAQLVEHRTFNAVVAGSSPARLTTLTGFIFSKLTACFGDLNHRRELLAVLHWRGALSGIMRHPSQDEHTHLVGLRRSLVRL